ncbi:MAG: TIR domain-containing protein [Verrucomicrobiia bacterium]
MNDPVFTHDVFLSHSSKDKAVVRPLAERLQKDGLNVWFDEWVLKPGDSIPAKIEEGLEHSRVLVLCMSANAFGSDWAQLEAGAFRFRDPLNQERRFIPLRLDDASIKGSLAQFLYLNWLPADREQGYSKLLEACRPPAQQVVVETQSPLEQAAESSFGLSNREAVWAYAFSPDGKRSLTGTNDNVVCLWDLETRRCLCSLVGHTYRISAVALSTDQRRALSGSHDRTVRLWDLETRQCIQVLEGHTNAVRTLAWSVDQRRALSGADDKTLRLWDVETGRCLRVLDGHTDSVLSVAWSADHRHAISSSVDKTLRLWDAETGRCLRVLEGHSGSVLSVAWSVDCRRALSGSKDRTLRLWDVETGRCLRVIETHTKGVRSVAWSPNQRYALTASEEKTVCLWDLETSCRLCVLRGHKRKVLSMSWITGQGLALSGDYDGSIRVWNLSEFVTEARTPEASTPAVPPAPDQIQYTNAKVLLVGESGAGKTGLSKRLALNDWQASDSTVGAWATQWKLPVSSGAGVEREIWLWDFGGQADQRLIHQLYMDETTLAVLVFDGQKEDLFETLGQWDRDLVRASRKEFAKLLVAGRVDAGGLRVSRSEVEKFAAERKFRGFLETSAKQNLGCEELKQAILAGINWDEIPCRTTEVLFKRLKEEIIRLKDEGRVLMRFNELRETLQLRLSGEFKRFADEELRAVLTLLAGPGVVWELAFGSWVLLQPERINAYAQAVIRTLQADEHQRGCLMEERVLKGDLAYESSMPRLAGDEERFVLLAMHQTLVERGLCLRQPTDKGNLLVFPSYYRRERPDLAGHPAVLSSYKFSGFLDEIYATLVVRLHHTAPFQQEQLWRYAADFKTNIGKLLGIKLTRRAAGVGELEVYFDPSIAMEEKIIFCKYVHEHLLQHARDVERLRHYVCKCGTPVGNREVARKRLQNWLQSEPPRPGAAAWFKFHSGKEEPPSIICVGCEQRVPLWDDMEQCFASPEIQQRVRDLQEESKIVLANESKERALVGDVISTVELAGQICREFRVSDHGLDMEIEFVNDAGEATRWRLYLKLKWDDSCRRTCQQDGSEVITIGDQHYARYWMDQAFPVMLVSRTADGEVQWMEVRDYLKQATTNCRKPVREFVFQGERLDVMSVRRWRDKVLKQGYGDDADKSIARLAKWAGGGSVVTLAVVFTDIVSSTELGNQAGDTDWNKIRKKHFARGQELVREMDGFLIKTIGDSLMVVFRNASAALDFAIEFRRDTGEPIVRIRQVAHIGPVRLEGDDVFGQHVNLSARVSGKAEGGEIVVTDTFRKDVDSIGDAKHKALQWESITGVSFKGFSQTFDLWRLR